MISKFKVQDKVRLTARCPERIDLPRNRPRTIINIRYDAVKQCSFYLLGSNGRGATAGQGDPRWGYWDYWFRSYQLIPYVPRTYHFKRKYTRKQPISVAVSVKPPTQKLAEQGRVQLVTPINATAKDTGVCR